MMKIEQIYQFTAKDSAIQVGIALSELAVIGVEVVVKDATVTIQVPEEHSEAIRDLVVGAMVSMGATVVPITPDQFLEA